MEGFRAPRAPSLDPPLTLSIPAERTPQSGPSPGSATDTVDTSGKNASKLIKLPSLKVIRVKQTKI